MATKEKKVETPQKKNAPKKVSNKKQNNKNFKPKKAKSKVESNKEVIDLNKCVEKNVNHPKHYTDNFANIEVIESNCDLTNCLSNVFKYCMRAGKKDYIIQELKKAKFYCNFYIDGVNSGKITPQNKISFITLSNIAQTSRAAIVQYENVTGTEIEEEWFIKSDLFSHFYVAIKATQEIAWWKFNKSSKIKEHILALIVVASCIDELIEYYNSRK